MMYQSCAETRVWDCDPIEDPMVCRLWKREAADPEAWELREVGGKTRQRDRKRV